MTTIRPGSTEDGRGLVLVADPERPAEALAFQDALAELGIATRRVALRADTPDRDATARIHEAARELIGQESLREDGIGALGLGRGATWALLAGCEKSLLHALVLVDPDPEYDGLNAAHPIQPLEMLLNLDAPLLCVYRGSAVSTLQRTRLAARAEAFARTLEVHDAPGTDSDPSDSHCLEHTRESIRVFLDEYLT